MFTKYKWSSTYLMVKQNFMGYHPPSPISNGGWECHQENTHSKHSNSWRFASETQDEQENHMGYFPPPQNDSSHYSNGCWEYHQGMKEHPPSRPSFSFESSSSLDYASTQSFLQNPYKSSHQSHNSFHTLNTTLPQHIHVPKITLNLYLLNQQMKITFNGPKNP
ncbi:hypothetical protein AHAS_Ahas14G0127200 [Arachis hypogaea]